ncbi:hypothetical protein ABTY53_37690 [Streptomyces noursei]|uniref:hypothetical protein n=1 Tax=Streptomyces noursei TaxID=1971 RepID=UPI003325DA2D
MSYWAVGTALSSVIFFNHLGGDGNPVTRVAKMPDAFAHTLPYIAAAFLAAFALLYAVPRRAGNKGADAVGDARAEEQAAQRTPDTTLAR